MTDDEPCVGGDGFDEAALVRGATPLDAAWDRVFALFDLNGKPRNESLLGLARDGHRNAVTIVRGEIEEYFPDDTGAPYSWREDAAAVAEYDALRDLLRAMGVDPDAEGA